MGTKYYASCSFGKDSLATVLLALEHGEPLDGAVYMEAVFDHSRGISGDNPEHIAWIRNYAAPKLEAMGCPVIMLRPKTDYVTSFNTAIVRGANKGLLRGFPYAMHCPLQKSMKIYPQRDFFQGRDCVHYVGIASDEPQRLKALEGRRDFSLLAKYGYTEAMSMELCRRYDLLSPIYQNRTRGGCWFCPNQGVRGFCLLRREHPELWAELVTLDRSVPRHLRAGKTIRYLDTVEDLERRMDNMEIRLHQRGQLTFDF